MPGKHNAGGCKCCRSACNCKSGTHPDTLTVVIAGITDVTPGSPGYPATPPMNCPGLNGTYILNLVEPSLCTYQSVPAAVSGCSGLTYQRYVRCDISQVGLTDAVEFRLRAWWPTGCWTPCSAPSICTLWWIPDQYRYLPALGSQCNGGPCSCYAPSYPATYQGDEITVPCFQCWDEQWWMEWLLIKEAGQCDVNDEAMTFSSYSSSLGCQCDKSSATVRITANGPFD